jgi:beta-aspartyl-peptidase (threonine type)
MLSDPAQAKPKWTLVIHGGAGIIEKDKVTPEQEAGVKAGLDAALDAGRRSSTSRRERARRGAGGGPGAGGRSAFQRRPRRGVHLGRANELDAAIMDGARGRPARLRARPRHATRSPLRGR